MKTNIIISTILLLLLSCNSSNKIQRENEPDIYNIGSNDIGMNTAIETAKQSLDSFDNAIKKNSRVFTYFGLKKKFEEGENIEHIWIGNIEFNNGKYIGTVDNLPEKIKSVKVGDTVIIDRNDISDWMYVKNSKLHGGYTIRLLRERMPEDERKQFDAESGLIIK